MVWVCHKCTATFPIEGLDQGARTAQKHEKECQSDVRIGVDYELLTRVEPATTDLP